MNRVIVEYNKDEKVVKVYFTTDGENVYHRYFGEFDQVGIIKRIMRWVRDGRIF